MSQVWMLSVHGSEEAAYKTAEKLGFLEDSEALAISVYEDMNGYCTEALYEAQADAILAQAMVGGEITQVENKDWVSETQSGLPPVEAGRFFVHGSHDTDKIPNTISHPILIDAGMAFGTGHHGTTKGCLVLFDDILNSKCPLRSVLDLGCGAGILAIAAAKALPNSKIMASDIDQDAIDVTKDNAKLNDVDTIIDSFAADGFETKKLNEQTFDLIFANILAGPLMGLAPEIFQATASQGIVILSGILNEQADMVASHFSEQGFNIESKISLGDWTSLLARRP